MGLHIEHIDNDGARGTLDGILPVRASQDGTTFRVRIAGWVHEAPCGLMNGDALMRYAVCTAVSLFRADHGSSTRPDRAATERAGRTLPLAHPAGP